MYLAASITLPPPMPMTAWVLFGSSKASSVISLKSTVSISWWCSTLTPAFSKESKTMSPNIDVSPLPKRITTCVKPAAFKYSPILAVTPLSILRIGGMEISSFGINHVLSFLSDYFRNNLCKLVKTVYNRHFGIDSAESVFSMDKRQTGLCRRIVVALDIADVAGFCKPVALS